MGNDRHYAVGTYYQPDDSILPRVSRLSIRVHRMTRPLKKQWPETIDEAIRILDAVLSNQEKINIRSVPREDLDGLYQGLGTLIRNEFGLLKGNNALITATLEIHANLATMTIIVCYWEYLNKAGQVSLH